MSSREEALCHIEFVAIGVKNGSSPGGAERITQETEALRGVWESLKERLVAEQEALRELQQSQEARVSLSGQLEREVTRLRTLVQKFGRELEDGGEEGSLAAWRKSAVSIQRWSYRIDSSKCDLRL